jgi:hypothetical protein
MKEIKEILDNNSNLTEEEKKKYLDMLKELESKLSG